MRSDVRIVDNGTARCLMCIGNVRTSDLKLAMESERSGAMLIVSQCHRAIYFVLGTILRKKPGSNLILERLRLRPLCSVL
eukprot:scaffold53015_cov44-Attheya_sp.AAC.1